MTDTRTEYIRKLNGFIRVCGDCISDLSLIRAGVPVYYNMDFSLLCPNLFSIDRVPRGSKEFLISEKASIKRVLDKRPSDGHYTLVVSGATIFEFFDQLDHTVRDIEERVPELRTKFKAKEMDDAVLLKEAWATSANIKKELSLLTQQGLNARLMNPITRLLSLLESHKVKGIGDVVDPAELREKTDRNLYNQFLAEQNSQRHDARFREDREFHYKIDATNNCLTVAAAAIPGIRAAFVTSTPLNIQQCMVNGKAFARVARTPLFMLNLDMLKRSKEISDELEYITAAAKEAVEIQDELAACSDFDSAPPGLKIRLARFYAVYVGPLNKGATDDETTPQEKQIEEIMKNLADETRLQAILKDAVQFAREGARMVEAHSSGFDLPYLNEFDFEKDPVVLRIKNDLGLKN